MIWRYGKFAAPWHSYSKCSPFYACVLQPLYEPAACFMCVCFSAVEENYEGTISVLYKLIHGVL